MDKIKTSAANQDEILVWKRLQQYSPWKRLCELKKKDIEAADTIINTIGFDREKMFSERDVAIIRKQAILDLINAPQKMIDLLSGTGVVNATEEFDPFEEVEDEDGEDLFGDNL